MRRLLTAALICALPYGLMAQDHAAAIDAALDRHVLPGVARLASTAADLADTAQTHCTAVSSDLRAAYHTAFDAWIHVSHLRFGPFESENRAFALAFWPDSRGATPRALSALLDGSDPVANDVDSFAAASVAARGFYALEFLLFDEDIAGRGDAPYRCALIQVVTADVALTAATIRDDWAGTHAALMRAPNATTRYQSEAEALRALFNALTTGLEFNADVRLGRPLGTFDRPHPLRAEARRSLRSLRNLQVSMAGLSELAEAFMVSTPAPADAITAELAFIAGALQALDDPTFSGVSDPQARLRIEAIQQRISELRQSVLTELGPSLGMSAGFNSLDGD